MTLTALQDEIVLVTGASAGVGLATARHFAENGARVIAAARRLEKLQALTSAHNGRILPLQLDVRDRDVVDKALGKLPADWKDISIVVNNAGIRAGTQPLQEANPADWDAMIDTNIRGLLNVTHAVLPRMVAARRGHLINIGSNSVRFPYKTGGVYTATKAAIESISTGLRIDLADTGVRTTQVNLGLVRTDISLVRFGGDRTKADAHYAQRPCLEPNEVAQTIVWVASLPERVEIADIRVFPTGQGSSAR